MRDLYSIKEKENENKSNKTSEWIKDVMLATAIVGVVSLAVWNYTAIPYVEYAMFNNVCLAVVPSSAGDCENLPEKYIPVIVSIHGAHMQ